MRTYYATIPAKTATEASQALDALSKSVPATQEIEVRQVVALGQQAVVVYLLYDKGSLR